MNELNTNKIETKILKPFSGIAAIFLIILAQILSAALSIAGMFFSGWLLLVGATCFCLLFLLYPGIRVLNPNEALVLTLFGKYYGTITDSGCFFVHPFSKAFNHVCDQEGFSIPSTASTHENTNKVPSPSASKKVSTKIMTLNNQKQKVNDILGNPVIIGAVVIWNVSDPTRAVFHVDNYVQFLSTQCDSTIRNTARLYPYDTVETDSDEKTLRGSSLEIAENMRAELQAKVKDAGLTIHEVRITHLSYSEEIAAAMLQRQQATAIIAARQKIVEGAVSMVKMAIDQLNEEEIVLLDEERKAAMVSNLLVVLCGNKDAQPIVNSGSIY